MSRARQLHWARRTKNESGSFGLGSPMRFIPSYRVLLAARGVSCFAAVLLFWLFSADSVIRAQNSGGMGQAPSTAGEASGPAHAPVMDVQKRPITAGGFVDGAPVVFVDITKQAGLDKFHHRSGTPGKTTIIEAPGSGVALLDFDKDGWLDI